MQTGPNTTEKLTVKICETLNILLQKFPISVSLQDGSFFLFTKINQLYKMEDIKQLSFKIRKMCEQHCQKKNAMLTRQNLSYPQYTLFIRTSNFCQGSLFIIFWLLQPQFVLSSVSGLKFFFVHYCTVLLKHTCATVETDRTMNF